MDFGGLKVSPTARSALWQPDVRFVRIPRENGYLLRRMNFEPLGDIGGGMNSGFQAINLAVQFGARRILLIGFDMRHGEKGELHHHGAHPVGLRNPQPSLMRRWVEYLDGQAEALSRHGVTVVNASAASALKKYPVMSVSEALRRWA